MVVVAVVFLIILGLAWVGSRQESAAVNNVAKTTTEQPSGSVQQTGRLTWTKPPGYEGKDSSERSLSLDTVVVRNDAEVMALTTGPAHFLWNKHEKQGKWYQDNSNATGKWYLLPTDNPKVFKGKVSDNEGNFVVLRLEIN